MLAKSLSVPDAAPEPNITVRTNEQDSARFRFVKSARCTIPIEQDFRKAWICPVNDQVSIDQPFKIATDGDSQVIAFRCNFGACIGKKQKVMNRFAKKIE